MRCRAAFLLLSALASACASAHQRPLAPPEGRGLLRAADVAPIHRVGTALEMLHATRPEFLQNRSRTLRYGAPTEPVVYVDGHRLADLSMLRHVAARSIVTARYLRGIDAVVRYGADHESGALFITTAFVP